VSGVGLALHAESFRTGRTRAVRWSVVFLAAVAAARVFAAHVAGAAGELTGAAATDGSVSGTAWGPFVDGWRTGLSAATLLLLLHATRTIAADRESGVLRVTWTRSTSRAASVVARALLSLALVGVAFVVTGVAAWAASAAFFDFGPLVEDGYEFLTAAELRAEVAHAAWAVLPAFVATYAFGLLISALVRSATVATNAALSLFLAFDLFKESFGEAREWVFASFVPSFVDGSALSAMSGVARGYSDAGMSSQLLERSLVVPSVQALVFVLLACQAARLRAG